MSQSPLQPQPPPQVEQEQEQEKQQEELEEYDEQVVESKLIINNNNNNNSNPPSPLIAVETDKLKNKNISNAPTPRLVLTQIELENFKSYYGRRIIGPFHKRFSSIVGPNGSGKSNVIDALLFVFGRRAKQIRLKKISELVHTSSSHPNCKQARVNIHFQEIIDNEMDENAYHVIPNSSFTISRIATKSNHSTYLINNKVSKIKKVKELLFTKGIDLNNNRFLILQGEVESIAMMKPKSMNNNDDGLLEYLEDIIGSNKYILEINRCSEQVETLTNEVQERLNRVKVVERDRDKLSVAKNEAQDYIKSQLQLWKLQAVSKQLFINRYHNKSDALNVQLVQFNNGINEMNDKLKKIQQEMKDIEDKYQQIRKEKNKVEKEVKKEEKQFQEFEQLDVSLTTRLKYLKKEMNKIKKNRNKLEKEKVEFTEKIAQNETLIPRLETEVEDMQINLRAQQEKQEEMMSALAERIQPIKEAMEEKQKELIPLKDRENSIKQKLDIIHNNISGINNKVTDAQQRKQDILNRITDINTNINNQTNTLNITLENELQTHNTNKTNMNNNITTLRNEEQKLQHDITHTRKEYDNARYLYENAAKSKQRIVGLLLAAQEKGDLTGILGRLGDLGSIDQRYDIAASTAATGPLNYIVVEKTHHAQRAVEYLKKHNLGRATMLILEKQKHLLRYANKKINTPQGVNRLYDLVTFKEERFNIAFYFAFRDTLVGKDLNEANNLAFSGGRRWRVVTLQGQLIETSGAMTGGGNKVFKGLMSDRIVDDGGQVSETELRAKESELRGMEGRLNEVVREIREEMNKMKKCQKVIDRLVVNKRKLRMEINGLQQRKLALEEQVPEIEAMTEINQDEKENLEALEEEKNERNEEFLSAQHDCELLEDEIRDLEEKILENGGNSLREQKNLQDRLKRKLKEKSKLTTKLKVEIKSLNKKLKSSSKKFANMEDNIVEMKAEYDDIKIKKKDLEEKAVELMTVLDGKKDVLREKDLEYGKLSKIVEKNNGMITKLTKEIFEEEEKRKNVKSELKQTQNRMKKSKKEWVSLQKKHKKNKHEFLRDDDDEDEDENENETSKQMEMEVDNEDTDIKMDENKPEDEVNDNKMDVDETDIDTDDNKHEIEEKAMELLVEDKHDISLQEYLAEHTLKLINLSADLLSQVDPSLIDNEITEIKSILESSAVNMGAIEAYFIKDSEYVDRLKDLKECKKNRDLIRGEYEINKRLRFDSFMSGFSAITKKLKEMYRMLTCGGDAELELVDSIDPFSEGVQFSVRPPKKSWKNISNLSGGEKTLSSMALVFALHHYKPTPLYVMDEIDAALDFKNVSIVANYIHQRTKNAQFVIISLRNNMFELANRLVGIYKTNNASKSITIDPQLFKLPSINNKQMHVSNHNVNVNVNVNVNHNHNDNDNEEDEDDDILVNKVSDNHNHNHVDNHNRNDMIEID